MSLFSSSFAPSVLATICACSISLGGDSRIHAQEQTPPVTKPVQYEADTAKVGFLLPGRELKWIPQPLLLLDDQSRSWLDGLSEDKKWKALAIGLPLEPFHRLVLKTETRARIIAWPGDLRGEVSLKSAEDALSFARLFSSVDTYYRFPMFNRVEIVSDHGANGTGPAKISAGKARALGLPATAAVSTPAGYRILRTLAQPLSSGQFVIEIVDEKVESDGAYEILVLWSATLSPSDAGISLPLLQ